MAVIYGILFSKFDDINFISVNKYLTEKFHVFLSSNQSYRQSKSDDDLYATLDDH